MVGDAGSVGPLTCSTASKTLSRLLARAPLTSASVHCLLSSSAARSGYLDTSLSPEGSLRGGWREPGSASQGAGPGGPHPEPRRPRRPPPPLTARGGGLASPGHTVVVPTQAHGSGARHLLDVVQVICGEAAREGPARGPGPAPRPLTPAHLPLGTSWPLLCRKRSHCRSSPSLGCPSASARERGWHCGRGGQAARASPGSDGPGPASHHQLEHVVGHVAPVLAHAVGRGVAEDHGGLGQLQHGLHGGRGRVGQVDDDAQSVHLLHDALRGDGAQGTRTAWRVSAGTLGPGRPCRAHVGSHDLLGFLVAAWEVQVWGRALARR